MLVVSCVLLIFSPASAAAEPPAATQYSFAPVPSADGENTLNGKFPSEQPGLLAPGVREQLTGPSGAQLRILATARSLGAFSPEENAAAERDGSGSAGPSGWLLPAGIVLLGLIAGIVVRTRSSKEGPSPWDTRAVLLAVAPPALVAGVFVTVMLSGGGEAGREQADPPPQQADAPPQFFGIVPQQELTVADTERMSEGGIESIRTPVQWGVVQPTAARRYNWGLLDPVVEEAANSGLEVLPFLYGTPSWLAPKPTTLPTKSAEQREAWTAFLGAIVKRYGPSGEFWSEHGPSSAEPVPKTPVRSWQIWNEANFFYFADPVSPSDYGNLVKISAPAIREVDEDATVVLSGLFGSPAEEPPRAMPAADFLSELYRVPRIRSSFDVVALHPYAPDAATLGQLVDGVRVEIDAAGDRAARIWLTEFGWGSQEDGSGFEKGLSGQATELTDAYELLLDNRDVTGVDRAYWFSWKDDPPPISCNFCDSVGFFEAGEGFQEKPAWSAFLEITGGQG